MGRIAVLLAVFVLVGKVFAYTDITPEEFQKLMEDKDAIILDVRTPEEFAKDGHIKGANLIPVQLFKYIYLEGFRDKKVLVYCRSGNRSKSASQKLEEMGIKQVYNLKGGIKAWKAKGLPVEYGWK
ncbi:MAG: rhodanese-like domain-containing protein [Aquificae bacterium]|nr:rhodanese-like domain-containing protein [Aquificota bacterium]